MKSLETIERELRYVLTTEQHERLVDNLSAYSLNPGYCVHELTVMYDNPNPDLTFYSQKVDGRLRLRTCSSEPSKVLKSPDIRELTLLTWKQRLSSVTEEDLRAEREVEISIAGSQTASLITLLEDVLHCPKISSYERIRETVYIDGIEVAVDEFPYGHGVELEVKDGDLCSLKRVKDAVIPAGARVSHLSCDDLYKLMCRKAGVKIKDDIIFRDDGMPKIDLVLDETCILTK